MESFENIDHKNELNLQQQLDIDLLFTVSGALTYLDDHVITSDKDAQLTFFDMHGVNDIDDFMFFTDIDIIDL
jgi:hypothetical protein